MFFFFSSLFQIALLLTADCVFVFHANMILTVAKTIDSLNWICFFAIQHSDFPGSYRHDAAAIDHIKTANTRCIQAWNGM